MKYYVINLEKRKDRWELFKSQFSSIDDESLLTRVNGVDFGSGDYIEPVNERAGCSAAHRDAITLGLLSGEDQFTVFEDDIFFYDHTTSLISKCLNSLKNNNWDLLYWGCAPREEGVENPLEKTKESFLLKVMCAGTAHAITYNRDFASRYVKDFPDSNDKSSWINWTLANVCHDIHLRKYQKEGNSYMPNKLCACQYNGHSDIDGLASPRQDIIEKQFDIYK